MDAPPEQAIELIDGDLAHWEIELIFLILKEGCCIEALQLGAVERIETSLERNHPDCQSQSRNQGLKKPIKG